MDGRGDAPSPSEAAATSSSTIEDETATREPPPKKPRKEGVAPAAGSWPERAPLPRSFHRAQAAKIIDKVLSVDAAASANLLLVRIQT